MPICGPSCKLRLDRFSVMLKFQDGPSEATMYFGLSELEVAAVVSGKGNINKNNISMDDIEKRKSFTDMNLVDVTSVSGSIEVIKIDEHLV